MKSQDIPEVPDSAVAAAATCSLLPCPFCGEPGALLKGGDTSYPCWFGHCSNDQIKLSEGACMIRPSTPPRYKEAEAVADWNRRANAKRSDKSSLP